jgi:hypothetical protein
MLDHIVLLKLKEGITESQLETMYQNISELKNKISGILSITYGTNNSPENLNQGFTHGFVVRFKDAEARNNYLPHPDHQRVAKEHIIPITEDVVVFDYDA